ncbi:P-loop containing nucleoside triphosphate hydrolases superfamily protein [Perilla frutescens var. hirtella]|nr:P-loop containing nucleoside triphosphate hydrolases superfamily protein [Perilla frutescens var. hirtella]
MSKCSFCFFISTHNSNSFNKGCLQIFWNVPSVAFETYLIHRELIIDRQMASSKGIAIVVMGVSGAGKSTVGAMLAEVMNGCFLDADDYHPQSNKEKMKAGIPLSDEDRVPWLETLRDTLRASLVEDGTMILGCSALQKHYREILRCADPDYVLGSYGGAIKFVLLSVGAEVLAARLEKRAAEGRHFMPAKLLQSQLDLLQIDESEGILTVDASLDPRETLKTVQGLLMPTSLVEETNVRDEGYGVK